VSRTRIRPAARVLLLDDDNRLLLLRMLRPATAGRPDADPGGNGARYWLLPGGGLHRGETYEAAAHREVFEETGIARVALGPCVWLRDQTVTWPDGAPMRVVERYFTGRVATGTPITFAQHEPLEATLIAGYRWFAQAEIEAREEAEVFAPPGLGGLFGELLRNRADGGEAEPVRLSS
jgi:8-oxo-dGTP pyrophosphatase MutT (NUDIX family)